jgi:hypothetical protein
MNNNKKPWFVAMNEPDTHVDAQIWGVENGLNGWGFDREKLEGFKAKIKPLFLDDQKVVEAAVDEVNKALAHLSKVAGLGDCTSQDGCGCPVYLDFYNPLKNKCGSILDLRLCVWADINQEETTHIIPLVGASEYLREEI